MNQKVVDFLQKPVVILIGLIGGLCSIIGILLSIYLSIVEPNLTYYYSKESHAQISTKYSSNGLHIFHDSHTGEIKEDISLIQICIWNAGRKPIEAKDIRDSIVLFNNNTEILEAHFIKTTSTNTKIRIDDLNKAKGMIKLSFDILEHDEGGVLQLLYIGNNKADFVLKGSIIGQRGIRPSYNSIPGFGIASLSFFLFGICFLVCSVIFLLFQLIRIAFKEMSKKAQSNKIRKLLGNLSWYSYIIAAAAIMYVLGCMWFQKTGLIATPFSSTEMSKIMTIGHFTK